LVVMIIMYILYAFILSYKTKAKAVPLHATETLGWRGGIARTHSRRRYWMVWVVSVTPQPRSTPGERTTGTDWIGGWVGPRAGLDTEARVKILCLCRGSNHGHPVCSQTLYWLAEMTNAKLIWYKTEKRFVLEASIHTYVHAYVHTDVRTYVHTYMHTYRRTYVYTYMHTYIHTRIYIRTYVRTYIHTVRT
jgi:hypothetical protein